MSVVEYRPAVQAGPDLTQLRLTARGRGVLWLAATVALSVLGVLAWLLIAAVAAPGAAAGDGGGGARTSLEVQAEQEVAEVTVRPGDSLWVIAERYAPSEDPRSVVAAVVELNDLVGVQIQAGQSLQVPVG